MHQKVPSPVRPYVPFVLNGRIWRYHFAPWKDGECIDQICVEIPMKYYPKDGNTWVARQVFVTFVKRTAEYNMSIAWKRPQNAQKGKTVLLTKPEEQTRLTETMYVCQCSKMYYDETNVPVIKEGS